MQFFAFKTSSNNVGFFQKDGNTVHITIRSYLDSYTTKKFKWDVWHIQSQSDEISINAVDFFLKKMNPLAGNITKLYPVKNSTTGNTYPRMNFQTPMLYKSSIISIDLHTELRAYYNLCESMESIFQVIEPHHANNKCYGHKIREILTIACTEVEHHFVQILKENQYSNDQEKRYNTKDFVTLLPILKLDQYAVFFQLSNGLGSITPFSQWNDTKPTESLAWYHAYNKAKHDRKDCFSEANLENMVNAICAIHVLLVAQYGEEIFNKFYGGFDNKLYTYMKPTFEIEEFTLPIYHPERDPTKVNSTAYFSGKTIHTFVSTFDY